MGDQPQARIQNELIEDIRLALINNQEFIPIIGFDAIPVKTDEGYRPYLDFLADRIAADKQLTLNSNLKGFDRFNDISHKLLVSNRFNRRITTKQISEYARDIHDLVDKEFLSKIVTIFPFKYFLNLTFTSHLSEVVKDMRTFPKIAINESAFPFIAKNPARPEDLKKNSDCVFVATIYNLLGVSYTGENPNFNYYYSDDDMLAFIAEFSKWYETTWLTNYKDVTKDAALLFIGCRYSDWLLRILINTLSPGALNFNSAAQTKIFLDYCNDDATLLYLNRHELQFQKDLDTISFVGGLHNVLAENRFALNTDRNNNFVFVSYTRDNLDIVQKIVCQLSCKMNVWFDRIKLFPGHLINDDIRLAINNCRLFLPVITLQSVGKQPGDYVRQEWIYYGETQRLQNKVIPLVYKTMNTGTLGLIDIDREFSTPGGNMFHIKFGDEGLSEEDIQNIKNRL